MRHLMFLIAATFLLSACDLNSHTDNGRLEVTNRTDQHIVVYYEREYEIFNEWVETRDKEKRISPGDTEVIYVDSFLWDAEIEVEYNGFFKEYDIDFNAAGMDSINIDTEDFPSPIFANG